MKYKSIFPEYIHRPVTSPSYFESIRCPIPNTLRHVVVVLSKPVTDAPARSCRRRRRKNGIHASISEAIAQNRTYLSGPLPVFHPRHDPPTYVSEGVSSSHDIGLTTDHRAAPSSQEEDEATLVLGAGVRDGEGDAGTGKGGWGDGGDEARRGVEGCQAGVPPDVGGG